MTFGSVRSGLRTASATAVVLTASASVVVGCTRSPDLPLPGRWEGDGGVITLMADGEGELEGVPIGTGRGCDKDSLQRFDGHVAWEESDPGTIEVRAGEVAITLWADRGGFGGDISWYKIAVGPCGDRTTSAEVVTFTRDTAFDN